MCSRPTVKYSLDEQIVISSLLNSRANRSAIKQEPFIACALIIVEQEVMDSVQKPPPPVNYLLYPTRKKGGPSYYEEDGSLSQLGEREEAVKAMNIPICCRPAAEWAELNQATTAFFTSDDDDEAFQFSNREMNSAAK